MLGREKQKGNSQGWKQGNPEQRSEKQGKKKKDEEGIWWYY